MLFIQYRKGLLPSLANSALCLMILWPYGILVGRTYKEKFTYLCYTIQIIMYRYDTAINFIYKICTELRKVYDVVKVHIDMNESLH